MKKIFRVLIASDMHYTTLYTYSNMDKDDRLQLWVDGIIAENKSNPIDLIIILGDMSLDHWGWNGGGSWQREPRESETKLFMERYLSQLPKDITKIVLPGNHELYSNEKWKELTGYNRNESFVLGNNLFIMLDSYAGAVDPVYQGKGINDNPYKPVDMEFIKSTIDAHSKCTNVFLLSHHFDLSQENEAFKNFLKSDKRIQGLFSGHTHKSNVINLGEEYNDLSIAQTGGFLYEGNRGYRDIVIKNDEIVSQYIIPQCQYIIDGIPRNTERTSVDILIRKI